MGFAWVVFFAIIGNRPYCLLVVLFVSRVTSPFALGPSSALFCPQPQPIKPLPPKPTRKPRQSAKPTSTTATTPPLATLTTNNVDDVNRGVDSRVTDDPFEGGFVAQDTGVDLEAAARRRVSVGADISVLFSNKTIPRPKRIPAQGESNTDPFVSLSSCPYLHLHLVSDPPSDPLTNPFR